MGGVWGLVGCGGEAARGGCVGLKWRVGWLDEGSGRWMPAVGGGVGGADMMGVGVGRARFSVRLRSIDAVCRRDVGPLLQGLWACTLAEPGAWCIAGCAAA